MKSLLKHNFFVVLCHIFSIAMGVLLFSSTTFADTFVVDDTGDAGDNVAGDSACDTGGGVCTLRAAIEEANALAGTDTINFNIAGVGPHIITIGSGLTLNDATGGTTINGFSETDSSANTLTVGFDATYQIIVDAGGASLNTFVILSDDNIIEGLNIRNADGSAFVITNGAASNHIRGNYIGTDEDGDTDLGFSGTGIFISNGSNGNIIGTDGDGNNDVEEKNLISGNNGNGFFITNSSLNTIIAGNTIGLNADGDAAIANGEGITILNTSTGTRIGTDGDGVSDTIERNVISGNTGNGIDLSTSENTIIAGNFVGIGSDGVTNLGNGGDGIEVNTTISTRIGTDGDGNGDAAEGNVISGNTGDGIEFNNGDNSTIAGNIIGLGSDGDATIPNQTHGISLTGGSISNVIGTDGDNVSDDIEKNFISFNDADGINISSSNSNTIAGNTIGLAGDGFNARANDDDGIEIVSSDNITIGVDGDGSAGEANEGNTISANLDEGILVQDSTGLVVAGNFIGISEDGTFGIGNQSNGVSLELNSDNARIGTNGDGVNDNLERNVISTNLNSGILIEDSDQTFIANNFIGTDITGLLDFGNILNGIAVSGTSDTTTIGTNDDGTADANEGNVISGNNELGISLNCAGLVGADSNHVIAGNTIGLASNGTNALGNDRGIFIASCTDVLIGTDGDATNSGNTNERNIISSNEDDGITIGGSNEITIAGNLVGVAANGTTARGNGDEGIDIDNSTDIDVGVDGDASAGEDDEPNVIANNTENGMEITNNNTQRIRISQNSFFNNGLLAIDLSTNGSPSDGVTLNDDFDTDIGPNGFLNSSDNTEGRINFVRGKVDTTNPETMSVEIYEAAEDPTQFGEGEIFVAAVTPSEFGTWEFFADFEIGDKYTVLTIDANGNTSEFARVFDIIAESGGSAIIQPGSGFGSSGNIYDDAVQLSTIEKEEALIIENKDIVLPITGKIANDIIWKNTTENIKIFFSKGTQVSLTSGQSYTGRIELPRLITEPQQESKNTISILEKILLQADKDIRFSKPFIVQLDSPKDTKNKKITYFLEKGNNSLQEVDTDTPPSGAFVSGLFETTGTFILGAEDKQVATETETDSGKVLGVTTEKNEETQASSFQIGVIARVENVSKKEHSFADLQNHWSKEYVMKLYENKVINGYTNGLFGPNDNVTRAQLIKIVMNAFGYEIAEEVFENPFTDVAFDTWHAPYITKAKEVGIVQGYEDGTFEPEAYVNRAEAIKIIMLASEKSVASGSDQAIPFHDVDQSEWYVSYLKYMLKYEVIGGYEDNSFRAANQITRGEVSKIVVKMMEL